MAIHSAGCVDEPVGADGSQSAPERLLRTAVWHGDESFSLPFPVDWQVTALWPATPPPLSENQLAEILSRPAGQAPIPELCRGRCSPIVLVDDPARPTPAALVLPFLLRQFQIAGIPPNSVRILVASGAHGPPRNEALIGKLGPAAAACQVLVHNPHENLVEAGVTGSGTRVWINRAILGSDFLIGIGGIYPDRIAGFGGGSKLVCGVLGIDTLRDLHRRHAAAGWGQSGQNEFRSHMDEIAQTIGLRSMISLQIDAGRNIVRAACGDPFLFYPGEAAEARRMFAAPPPEDADVVVSNAYPGDLSLTSVEMRGLEPLRRCAPAASRIVLAACPEGMGSHELFPLGSTQQSSREPAAPKRRWRFWGSPQKPGPERTAASRPPIWLYRPGKRTPGSASEERGGVYEALPSRAGGFQCARSWTEVVDAVRIEQVGKPFLRVYLYPCAPLQCFDERPRVV